MTQSEVSGFGSKGNFESMDPQHCVYILTLICQELVGRQDLRTIRLPGALGPFHGGCIPRAVSADTRCQVCRLQLTAEEVQVIGRFLEGQPEAAVRPAPHLRRLRVFEYVGRPWDDGAAATDVGR